MLNYAKEHAEKIGVEAFIEKTQADKLPFENNFFDAAVFIDALHCIETKESREKALHELFRVLKPGCQAIISVWDKEQERFKNEKKEVCIPWKINEKVCNRYYYLYDKKEIIDLLKLVGFLIVEIFEKQEKTKEHKGQSIVIIARKPNI